MPKDRSVDFLEKHCAICLKNNGKMACFFIGNQRKILKKCKKTLAIPVFMPYNNSCCDIECRYGRLPKPMNQGLTGFSEERCPVQRNRATRSLY